MRECGCRWDGALEGRIIRCKKHRALFEAEHKLWKEHQKTLRELRKSHG